MPRTFLAQGFPGCRTPARISSPASMTRKWSLMALKAVDIGVISERGRRRFIARSSKEVFRWLSRLAPVVQPGEGRPSSAIFDGLGHALAQMLVVPLARICVPQAWRGVPGRSIARYMSLIPQLERPARRQVFVTGCRPAARSE